MSCEPKIVETRQVNNGQVSYRIVCCEEKCGEQCTPEVHRCEDSWHTLAIEIGEHESHLSEQKAEVAARHSKMKAWREISDHDARVEAHRAQLAAEPVKVKPNAKPTSRSRQARPRKRSPAAK